jgi:formiminotetrahydrofolate cyclodeaminase
MKLVELLTQEFVEKVASEAPAPGGGSVSALAGALAAALCAMVARLTLGKEKYRDTWQEMEQVRDSADALMRRLLELVDEDTAAYNEVLSAFRLPKETPSEKAARQAAIQSATRKATAVPMETLRNVAGLLAPAEAAVEKGNPQCLSDAGVAAHLVRAAASGAAYNVRINLSGLDDPGLSTQMKLETTELLSRVMSGVAKLQETLNKRLR